MRKKGIWILPVLTLAMLLGTAAPATSVYATESTADESTQTEEQTEPEIPESYYLPIESNAVDGWPAGPQVEAEAAVVMDANTGAFLYSKNMEAKEYPASITKVMTTLVAIENGDLDSKVKFSDEAINSLDPDSSRLWMEVGEKITVRRALYGVMLASANDCANGVAEKVGGSIENFVQMMNDKAAELGCVNTHFTNTHGLHNENHYTCAKDMAIIMQAAMENETFAEIAKTVEYSYPKTNKTKEKRYFMNHHKMLLDDDFYYDGCIGGKTGFTSDALNTLVTTAKRDKRTLICVVLRTNGSNKTFNETAALLDYGFDEFSRVKIPISDMDTTRAEAMGFSYLGDAKKLVPEVLNEKIANTAKNVKVSLPSGVEAEAVKRVYTSEGTLSYTYNDWQVANVPVEVSSVDFEIPKWEVINEVKHPISSETETAETEPETGMLQGLSGKVRGGLESASHWVNENDIMVALIGLILIIALLPILIVAYIRSRKSGMIRKQRKKEKEELVQREEDIDSKSVHEIEAEIRAELEKEKAAKEREEARKQEALEAERKIKEMEQVIEQKETEEAIDTANKTDTTDAESEEEEESE